jgi:hypothetical protein
MKQEMKPAIVEWMQKFFTSTPQLRVRGRIALLIDLSFLQFSAKIGIYDLPLREDIQPG